jgi:hypothetical protein
MRDWELMKTFATYSSNEILENTRIIQTACVEQNASTLETESKIERAAGTELGAVTQNSLSAVPREVMMYIEHGPCTSRWHVAYAHGEIALLALTIKHYI